MPALALQGAPAPKADRSTMETLIIEADTLDRWRIPPFQRPLRVNAKVQLIAEQIRQTENIDGIVTLGKIGRENTLYVVDGQHRLEAFRLAGISMATVDLRICSFDSMAQMADEFVRLNSSIVRMRPDDVLRGMEPITPALAKVREACDFVGFDNVRRGGTSPMLSMSAAVRCWEASLKETPTAGSEGVASVASALTPESAEALIQFLLTAKNAWGRDVENYRLWGNLNLALNMWLWRRMVIDRDRSGSKRYAVLNVMQFKQCMMSLSADRDYVDWLQGRLLNDRDRSPGYTRIRTIFVRRMLQENGQKIKLPQPAWNSG